MATVNAGEDDAQGMTFTRLFTAWLASENCALAIATDLPTGLCMVGRQKDGKVMFQAVGEASYSALAIGDGGAVWAAEKNFLWKWENITETGGYQADGARLYAPRARIFTSDLGTRDMAVDGNGSLLLASGAYSVVGRATPEASFETVWKPPFITAISREDRCGLSGLGLYDQERHCVTMWGRSDKPHGWKNNFDGGGCVMLIHDSSILCEGLCLPRAPRWRGEDLYLLNAGTAEFGRVDRDRNCFVPICQCPGYPTGLAFVRQWAVVSVSSSAPAVMEGLDLPATASFAARKVSPFSGLLLIDLATGDIAHHAYGESEGFTVSGVAVLPGCPLAMAITSGSDKLDALVTVPRRNSRA